MCKRSQMTRANVQTDRVRKSRSLTFARFSNVLICVEQNEVYFGNQNLNAKANVQHPEKRQGVQTNFSKTKRAAFPLCQRQRCKGAFLQNESKKENKQLFLKTYDLHLCTLLFLQCKNVKHRKFEASG